MSGAVLRTDGGSRGNPGPAGAGFVIERRRRDHLPRWALPRLADQQRRRVRGAHLGARERRRTRATPTCTVYADSELLVKQINGQYRVKNEGLKPLFVRALGAAARVRDASRSRTFAASRTQTADAMANEAMDARATVGDPACGAGRPRRKDSLF